MEYDMEQHKHMRKLSDEYLECYTERYELRAKLGLRGWKSRAMGWERAEDLSHDPWGRLLPWREK